MPSVLLLPLQVGLLLLMFLIGLEVDTEALRARVRSALVVSQASIAVPLGLGAVLALMLYGPLSDEHVPRLAFVLFMAAAMSVTAFPVLARIIAERDLTGTPLGALSLACAAFNDVIAWLTLAGLPVFVAVMLGVVRPALGKLRLEPRARDQRRQTQLAGVLVLPRVISCAEFRTILRRVQNTLHEVLNAASVHGAPCSALAPECPFTRPVESAPQPTRRPALAT